ncbi:hypothetical protein Tco_1106949 [Tanacetum coccineum]
MTYPCHWFSEQVGLAGDLVSTNDILIPLLFKTSSLDYSNSPEFDLFSEYEEQSEGEVTEMMTEPTMEEYMTKTRNGYGSGIVRPKIEEKDYFQLKGQFLKELRDNTFSGLDNEDANEHIEKVLEIEVILFYKGLDVPTRQILNSKGAIPSMKAADAKKAIQEMADYSQKWHNETSSRLTNPQGLNPPPHRLKPGKSRKYVAQVGCELCKGPHYTKDFPLKDEGKTLEEAYYTQFGVPFQQGGQYRAAAPGFY